ncbi:MAG: hypothetical protein IT366_23955 [Candidatus Hydrogenedentes bacterium]|nr:hypothetical protein [Candidatus Hydrogenedentota bacterium]
MPSKLTVSGMTRFDKRCETIARTVALSPPDKLDGHWAFYGDGVNPDDCVAVGSKCRDIFEEFGTYSAPEVMLARFDPNHVYPPIQPTDTTFLSAIRQFAETSGTNTKVLDLLVIGRTGNFVSTDYHAACESFLRGFANPLPDVDHEEWLELRGAYVEESRERQLAKQRDKAMVAAFGK